MTSRFLNSLFFTKERAESLEKDRIIKTNLIHVHGLPKSLLSQNLLKSPEYFGQYGNIIKIIISHKKSPDNNRKKYSVYITYSNEREASLAILCVDSLMIQGKLIRVFFGTTKYCSYFLNNSRCQISDKCNFLHRIETNKNFIINSNKIFSYNEHLQLAKKLIQLYIPEIRKLMSNSKKPKKNVFPLIDFIFLNEEEKEIYFGPGDISYIRNTNSTQNFSLSENYNNNKINNNFESINKNYALMTVNNFNDDSKSNNSEICNDKFKNVLDNNVNYFNNLRQKGLLNNNNNNSYLKGVNNFQNTPDLYSTISTSIKNILLFKTYFNNIDKVSLKKMEFEYFKKDLSEKGFNVNNLLKECLDVLN